MSLLSSNSSGSFLLGLKNNEVFKNQKTLAKVYCCLYNQQRISRRFSKTGPL